MKVTLQRSRSLILFGALTFSITAASVSSAEESPTGTAKAPPPTVSQGEDGTGEIHEIVVTANKRSESAQKSPSAVTAISGDSLEQMGIKTALDLTKVVPGAEVIADNVVAQPFIRGVGSNLDEPYVDPGVGININDIGLPRYATGGSFFDLQRVEVLPGPQGTLYGGSASGGVINLIAVQPGKDFHGTGTLEGGNYGMFHAFVAQNLPVSNDFSLRAAFDFVRRDGYESRGFDSLDGQYSGRLSALWTPSENFKAYVFGSIFEYDGKPNAYVNSPLLNPSNPWEVPAVGPVLGNPIDVDSAKALYKTDVLGGRFDYTVNDLTLSYIPGVVIINVAYNDYAADIPFADSDKEVKFSNELRLANSEIDRNSWQIGLFQAHTNLTFDLFYEGYPALLAPGQINVDLAAYAQDVYRVADSLRVTVGGRYSYDSKSVIDGIGAEGPFSADHSWVHGDWKVGVDADLAKNVLAYGTIQTGYVPGGYSALPNSPQFSNNVNPETLLSFTAGVKSRFLDNKLTLNDEAYYYVYKGYQVVAFDLTTGSQSVYNVPKSIIYGDEVTLDYRFTKYDSVGLGINLMRAYFDNATDIGGQDLDGYQMANAPHTTAEARYEHRFDLSSGADISFRVQSHIQSSQWQLYNHVAGSQVSGYTKSDLTLTYSSPDASWNAGLWVRNVENTAVFQAMGAGGQPGPSSGVLAPPRTFGVRLSRNW